jgi:hypothetical protein
MRGLSLGLRTDPKCGASCGWSSEARRAGHNHCRWREPPVRGDYQDRQARRADTIRPSPFFAEIDLGPAQQSGPGPQFNWSEICIDAFGLARKKTTCPWTKWNWPLRFGGVLPIIRRCSEPKTRGSCEVVFHRVTTSILAVLENKIERGMEQPGSSRGS